MQDRLATPVPLPDFRRPAFPTSALPVRRGPLSSCLRDSSLSHVHLYVDSNWRMDASVRASSTAAGHSKFWSDFRDAWRVARHSRSRVRRGIVFPWVVDANARAICAFPLIVVAIVAALFAIYHTHYDWPIKTTLFFCSLGFSALSLRDQRLELSIGAHTMMNICAMMLPILFSHAQQHAQISTSGFVNNPVLIADAVVFAMLKGVLPFALMYWFLKKTNGWFVSKEAASAIDAQRV